MTDNNALNQAKAQHAYIAVLVAATAGEYDERFVAGWNMPGYMPDSEPHCYATAADAREALADEMEREADEAEPSGEDGYPYMDSYLAKARTATALREAAQRCRDGSGEFGETVGGWHWFVSDTANKDTAAVLDEIGDRDPQEVMDEHPLEVSVRSGWFSPSCPADGATGAEYRILLCTGGPAVRIVGELDDTGQMPVSARMECQDWGTPWIEYGAADENVLLTYAQHFYYGE